jgi:S1-C subfamily serine protease
LVGKNTAAIEVLAGAKPCMVTAIRERIAFLAQTEGGAAPAVAPLELTTPQPFTAETTKFGATSGTAVQGTLSRIFRFEMFNAQVSYLERITGPAMHIYSDSASGVKIRDYRVDGCEVQALTEGAEVLRYSLTLAPTCNFDLSEVGVPDQATTRGLTVGKFFSGQGGVDTYVRSDCIYSCGNAFDPTIDFIWQGPHSSNYVSVVLTVTLADTAALNAATTWEHLMRSNDGDDYVIRTKFNCDRKYDDAAIRAFANVLVNKITVGFFRHDPTDCSRPQSPAPVTAESDSTSGTGFFVSTEGRVLTNDHVVKRCQQIRVHSGSQDGTARVVARDDENDLALLATDLHPPSPAKWRLSIRQGEDIIVYGFPLAGVLARDGNVAVGNITALAGLGNDSRFLQISAPVQPGNSGGPLLDRNGNVVGIVVAKLNALGIASATGDIPQNVNFAIKASVAAAFLKAQGVLFAEGAGAAVFSTPDIAERAKALTVQAVCLR